MNRNKKIRLVSRKDKNQGSNKNGNVSETEVKIRIIKTLEMHRNKVA